MSASIFSASSYDWGFFTDLPVPNGSLASSPAKPAWYGFAITCYLWLITFCWLLAICCLYMRTSYLSILFSFERLLCFSDSMRCYLRRSNISCTMWLIAWLSPGFGGVLSSSANTWRQSIFSNYSATDYELVTTDSRISMRSLPSLFSIFKWNFSFSSWSATV